MSGHGAVLVNLLASLREAFGTGDGSCQPVNDKLTSGIDRRRFLQFLGGTAAGVALAPSLDLERLLWVPGQKTIFLPAEPVIEIVQELPGGQFLLTPQWITEEALRLLKNQLQFAMTTSLHYERQMRRGDTVRIPTPVQFIPVSVPSPNPNAIYSTTDVTLDEQRCVALDVTEMRECRSREEASDVFLKPAMVQLAADMKARKLDVFADLPLPFEGEGIRAALAKDPEGGLSLRGIQAYELETDRELLRFDVLGGSTTRGKRNR